ncbi:MAG: fused MFS/spermidine synthase [Myxococcota bacterium]
MTVTADATPAPATSAGPAVGVARRPLVIYGLLFVFFFSGASSLVYQVVWQRLLTYLYGSGFLSVTLIVSVYMAGLGLGAIWGGRVAERWKGDRLTLYLFIEIGIGVFGILSWPFLGLLESTTANADYFVSALCMCLFLCVPTILMGFTLPIVVNVFDGLTRDFRRSVSLLYFANTLGAAAGAFVGGLVLITFLGFRDTLFVAAAVNLGLGLSVMGLRKSARRQAAALSEPRQDLTRELDPSDMLGRKAYVVVLVTGFVAIGYEIVFFRVVRAFSEFLSTTSYAFALVLGIYLVGIALGSIGINAYLARPPRNPARRRSPRDLLFLVQLALALWVPLATVAYLAIFRSLGGLNNWVVYGAIVLVPAMLMGASFPLVSAVAVLPGQGAGRTVGNVYFWNVVGNLAGGLATGLVLLPLFGTERTLVLFSAAGALLFLFCRSAFGLRLAVPVRAAIVAAAIAAAALLMPGPGQLYAKAIPFRFPEAAAAPESYHVVEGIGGVVVRYQEGGALRLRIDWSSHGDWPGYRFAHRVLVAATYPQKLDNVLIVGIGVGMALEPLIHSDAKRIDVVEINPTLMTSLYELPEIDKMLSDPRVHLHVEDARRFFRRDDTQYDLVVTPNMIHADAFSTNVQSVEFLRQIAEHLAPGGVAVEWVDEAELLPRTFAEVFPYVDWLAQPHLVKAYVWPVDQGLDGYLIGSNQPFGKPDLSRRRKMEKGLGADYMRGFRQSREEMVHHADRDEILHLTAQAPLITDSEPWLEYGPWWRLIGEEHPRWNVWTDIDSIAVPPTR